VPLLLECRHIVGTSANSIVDAPPSRWVSNPMMPRGNLMLPSSLGCTTLRKPCWQHGKTAKFYSLRKRIATSKADWMEVLQLRECFR
jgi:hypothetical protein